MYGRNDMELPIIVKDTEFGLFDCKSECNDKTGVSSVFIKSHHNITISGNPDCISIHRLSVGLWGAILEDSDIQYHYNDEKEKRMKWEHAPLSYYENIRDTMMRIAKEAAEEFRDKKSRSVWFGSRWSVIQYKDNEGNIKEHESCVRGRMFYVMNEFFGSRLEWDGVILPYTDKTMDIKLIIDNENDNGGEIIPLNNIISVDDIEVDYSPVVEP